MTAIYQPPRQEIELDAVLAALGDPVRLAIVSEIHSRGKVASCSLDVDVCKSTLSHHLKVLREAGITWTEIDGVERQLSLRYACLEKQFPNLLDSVLCATARKGRK